MPGVEEAILTALEKLPADRHPRVAAFLAALSAAPTTAVSRAAQRSWIDRHSRVLLAGTALMAVGAVAYSAGQQGNRPPEEVNRFIVSLDTQSRLDGSRQP